ncbi:hypothetical protein [Winogradskyella ludwigii]|uniref:hypothetical protein n=1 Tax=Winogradskyella ludwigii TaxID=2686076 RepID=UPI0015C929B9|nr:hypothetical protein [Winogradskyella ludwigii]
MFPVNEIRQKFLEILKSDDLWDKNVADLVVTKAAITTMELRATFSAKNASDIWNLRCNVREKLIVFIQKTHENGLPIIRLKELSQT